MSFSKRRFPVSRRKRTAQIRPMPTAHIVAVELTVENGKITDLTITSAEKEDTAYLDAASAVIDSILEQQSTDVDTVSGATFSSNGILHAAEDALRKAEKNHA